jgi:hypothetical protein
MEGVLKKLRTAVDGLATNDVVWDMTSRHPVDTYIDVVALVLIQLLEIRGLWRAGNDARFCAAVDGGACGVVVRARTNRRALRLEVVSYDEHTGARDSVKVVTFYPEHRRDLPVDWEPGRNTYDGDRSGLNQ